MARFEKDSGKSRRVGSAGTRLRALSGKGVKAEAGAESNNNTADESEEVVPVPLHIQNSREMNSPERIGILVCTFILAGMILFVLTGYERITRSYAAINTLNAAIDDAKLRISELNVAIECAVTIDQAENAALAAGMTYPTESQIYSDYRFPNGTMSISQPANDLPVSDSPVSENTPAGSDPTGSDLGE